VHARAVVGQRAVRREELAAIARVDEAPQELDVDGGVGAAHVDRVERELLVEGWDRTAWLVDPAPVFGFRPGGPSSYRASSGS
jgi:hypothetical protein